MHLRRCAVVQALMWALGVVKLEIAVEPLCDGSHRLVVVQGEVLVFHRPPAMLHTDGIDDAATSILICTPAVSNISVKGCAVN